jgi:peptide/nickel transport system permease protein
MVIARVAGAIVTLLIASAVIFVAIELLPGDPGVNALGRDASPERIAALREELDLDRPVVVRYADWLAGVVQLDLGRSAINDVPVTELVGDRLSNTLLLLLLTMLVLLPLALGLGTLSALRQRSKVDLSIQLVTLAAVALPEFVVGVTLVVAFAVHWNVFPAVSLTVSPSSVVLPVATLVILGTGYTIRMVRAGVLEVLDRDYVAMARLKGMPEHLVIVRHVLPNALGPTLHTVALTVAWLAGGVVIVEYLFSYPGVGLGLVDAVASRDFPTVEALALAIAAVYVFGNLAADLFTTLFTPRLRTQL